MCRIVGPAIISIELGANAEEYNARSGEVLAFRPERCPGCQDTRINVHDWYPRWAAYPDRDIRIRVQRFRCLGCRKTIAALPSFLHRYRQYALETIEKVVQARGVAELSWQAVAETCSVEGQPSVSSIRRWWTAFSRNAPRWLEALTQTLAQAVPGSAELDPHARIASAAATVLGFSRRLARWLDPRCAESDALRVMWCWGWNAGIGRLM